MRTLNVFTFNELSETAKQNAVESYRAYRGGDDFYFSEYKASLAAFADDIGININNWSYGLDCCTVDFDFGELEMLDTITGARAYAWIVNNVKGLRPGPRVYAVSREVNRHGFTRNERIVKRVSRVYRADDYCNYTGVCCDEYLLQPFREFLLKPDSRSVEDLIKEAIDSYCCALHDDLEYHESDEYLTEELSNGDTPEFFENGTIYA